MTRKRSHIIAITITATIGAFLLLVGVYLPAQFDELTSQATQPTIPLGTRTTLHEIVEPEEDDVVLYQALPKAQLVASLAAPNLRTPNRSTQTHASLPPKSSSHADLNTFYPALISYQALPHGFHQKSTLFTVPDGLLDEVEFWKNIYAQYDEFHTVLHDGRHLNVIYGVLDFTPLYENPDLDLDDIYKRREAIIEEYKDKIKSTLAKIKHAPTSTTLSPWERKIVHMFEGVPGDTKYTEATKGKRVRAQNGLKNRFLEGLIVSGEYNDQIEAIFTQLSMPRELTRMIFVESMFNMNARSHVGASGIWQFMPGTAKRFITVNTLIDERNDPIRSTFAAAKLLRANYNILHSWPLAINAYNSGPSRLKKAVKQLGTRDITTIIHNFKDKSGYGFASRNFYPSFLAALEVSDNHTYYFGNIDMDEPLRFELVQLSTPVSLVALSNHSGIELDTFTHLNPALDDHLFEKDAYLPKGYDLRIPHGHRSIVEKSMSTLAARHADARWHVAKKGQRVSRISKKYGVPAWKIRKNNYLWGDRLHDGQVLHIPAK